jgi:hypothetical protein
MHALLDEPAVREETPVAIITTLYDLIEAMQDEVEPDDDGLIVASIIHLLQSGRITFLGAVADSEELQPALAGVSYS